MGRTQGIKERLRNPLAHGGFERGWASLYFHFHRVGAIPASLTRFRDGVRFNLIPVVEGPSMTATHSQTRDSSITTSWHVRSWVTWWTQIFQS
jgi:hypothetical protein